MLFWTFVAILILLACGVGTALLVLPRRDLFAPELAGFSIVLGAFVTSGSWIIFSSFLSGAPLRWAVTAVCLALFCAGLVRRFRSQTAVLRGAGWVVLLLWLVESVIVYWQSLAIPMASDALFIWEFKGRLAFLHGGAIPAEYFSAAWLWSHGAYPLEVPLLEAWIYSWAGQAHQLLPKFLFPLFFIGATGLLWSAVRRATGSAIQAGWASLLLFFIPWLIYKPGGVASGLADFPLDVTYLAALVLLLEWIRIARQPQPGASPIAAFACCLAALPWIKQEGLILAAVLLLIAVRFTGPWTEWRKRAPTLLFLAAVPFCVTGAWHAYLASRHCAPAQDFLRPSLSTFAENSYRLIPIAYAMVMEFLSFDRWGLLWPLAFIAIFFLPRRYPLEAGALALAMGIPIVLFGCVYVFSAWPSYVLHINTSLTRLLISAAMPAILALGLWLTRGGSSSGD